MSARTRAHRQRMHRSRQRTPMTRPQPRDTRSSKRATLDHKKARQFNATRCLPADLPRTRRNSELTDEYLPVSDGVFRRCERWLNRSGLVDEIALKLDSHTAPASRLTVKATLIGMVLTLYLTSEYERTQICKILCGLTAEQAHRVGLCHPETGYVRVSYDMVQTQVRRIENALHEGWDVPADERTEERISRNLQWFATTAITHSIPDEDKALIAATALDSTATKTWARERVHGPEDELQEALKQNPPPSVADGEPVPIGAIGPHGRIRRTKCPDALPAYTADGMVTGFDVHMVTAIRDAVWRGDPFHIDINRNDAVIPYILSVVVMPGLVDYAQSGVLALKLARENAPNARELIMDMGFSQVPEFLKGARRLRFEPVFDYKSDRGNAGNPNQRVYMVHIGTANGGETVLIHDGVILPLWTPLEWQAPPIHLTGDDLAEWRARRYQMFGYVCTESGGDGSYRIQCPQCAGKVRTTAATRSAAKKSQPNPPTLRPKSTPGPKPKPHPVIKIPASFKHCCGGVRTIRPETATDQLVQYQHIPHGTPAWNKRYGYRNPSEGTNSRMKNRGTLVHGWCKALGIAATSVGAVLGAVVLNLQEAELRRDRKKDKQTPNPGSPASRFATAVDSSTTITDASTDTGSPEATSNRPTPTPDVSDELDATPAAANSGRAPP